MGSSIPKEDQHEHRTLEHGDENLQNELTLAIVHRGSGSLWTRRTSLVCGLCLQPVAF